MTTLVDTNVILDVVIGDIVWFGWSTAQMKSAADQGPLVINDIVYSELAARYESMADVDQVLADAGLEIASCSRSALFTAGQAFRRYRARGGPRLSLLPDFLIGAQAQVEGWRLLSRDARRYRSLFPDVELITPQL